MNKILLILAIGSGLLGACTNTNKKENNNTHEHKDGSVHTSHPPDTVIQQEFMIADTTTGNSHDDHDHPHKH